MIRILIQIKDNKLYFKTKKRLDINEKSILNTNIISDNELVFSDEYIYENIKIFTSFLNEIINTNNVTEVTIYNSELVNILIDIFKNINAINSLILKDDVNITFKICEKITKTNINLLSCNNIHDFMIEYLDKHKVIVESRNELLFSSNFVVTNHLNKYTSLYYKKIITLTIPMTYDDRDDLETFMMVNNYIKVIHLTKVNKSDLEFLINLLLKYRKKNINIMLHDNISDVSLAEYIKAQNRIIKKKHNIKLNISYSDNYLRKNFLPQANINILKLCLIIILIIIAGSFTYVLINNYIAYQKDINIKNEIQSIIEDDSIVLETEKIIEEIESKSSREVVNDYIASLKTFNSDTVGWIQVNNTTIDYPIMQAEDNRYYLNKNIKHEDDFNGWIFMDQRNSYDFSDDNTIIYGHTNYNAAVMFGSLKNALNSDWQSNPENHIIKIDTVYESLEYKIFSAYSINTTSDYLNTLFSNDLDKYDFFTMLKNRSSYDFGTDIDHDDKIITLSTCDDGGVKRLVVHAVLVD